MALINVTPIMTSNTTPTPYVASASGIYSSSYPAYSAFNRVIDKEGWCNNSNTQVGWLMFDFGEIRRVSAFSISSGWHDSIAVNSVPKDFTFEASVDGISFDVLSTHTNEISWKTSETRVYNLGKVYEYRYYRVNIVSSNGHNYSSIAELNFYIDDDLLVNSNVSHKNASFTYTMPMNTTQKILAKTNDPRVGLLGMANDTENYGDLYVIGGDGKSHLTRSGIKSEVLFDGTLVLGNGVINKTLSIEQDMDKFSELQFEFGFSGWSPEKFIVHTYTVILDKGKFPYNSLFSSAVTTGSNYIVEHFMLTDKNNILFTECYKNVWGGNPSLFRIIGIY